MSEPHEMTAAELSAAYASKELSPVEVTESLLGRIEGLDAEINAFCLIDAPTTLAQAEASEERWMAGEPLSPLDGVPVGVKDLLLTKGWATRRGSLTVDPKGPWDEDAPIVARLREAGAVFIGKTTTPEFGWKGSTDCSAHRHHAQSVESRQDARRFVRRIVGGAGGAFLPAGARHRWRRLDPHSGEFRRRLWPQAELRPRAGLSAVAVRNRGACRPDEPHGARLRADDERDREARCARLVQRARRKRRPYGALKRKHERQTHRLQPASRLRRESRCPRSRRLLPPP